MLNNTYIESDCGARAYLYPREKVFYISSFTGSKKSALYYFYLNASSVPLGYSEKLFWRDTFPISATVNPVIRFITEFGLIFIKSLDSKVIRTFENKIIDSDEFVISSKLINSGRGMFKFYRSTSEGLLKFSDNGRLRELTFRKDKINFNATFIDNEE